MQPAANTKRGGDRYVENQPQDRLMKLEGVVEHMIYENTETGYAVFEVDAGGTDVIVAGNVGSVDNGMSVTVYGRMVNHPSYGEQFKAETCEASLPQDTTALLSYLSSGVLPYIGPSTAKKIVSMFGEDTLNVISETPQSLCRIKGITPEKAAAIRAALQTITQAEEDRTAYSEAPANAFGELMAELFTVKADRWTPVLRQFGRSLGKLIYFMDAACDLEEDRKKGQYNPLALLGVQSGADFRPQLTLLAGDAAEAFERLPIVQDAAILQNILYSGVWTRFEAAFRTKQEEPT